MSPRKLKRIIREEVSNLISESHLSPGEVVGKGVGPIEVREEIGSLRTMGGDIEIYAVEDQRTMDVGVYIVEYGETNGIIIGANDTDKVSRMISSVTELF
jgi:hypothetical protein